MSLPFSNPFKEFEENMKKNMEKLRRDFENLFHMNGFKLPSGKRGSNKNSLADSKKPLLPPSKKVIEDVEFEVLPPDTEWEQEGTEPSSSLHEHYDESSSLIEKDQTGKASPIVLGEAFSKQWNHFLEEIKRNSRALQEEWNKNWEKFTRSIKKRNEENMVFIQTTGKKMQEFFENQYHEMVRVLDQLERDLREKARKNRRAFFNSLMHSIDVWNKYLFHQQKQFEKTLSSINRWSWQNNIRFILYLLPILVVVALIFSILRPFIL